MIEMANELEPIVAYLACLRGGHTAILACPERPELITQIKDLYTPNANYEKLNNNFILTRNSHAPSNHLHPDLALLLSTSGSTGSAKCIKLTAGNLNANATSIAEYLRINASHKAITNLPLYYSYGLSVLNSHLSKGASIVVTDNSVTDNSFWELFKQENVTNIAGVPYVYEVLDRMGFMNMDIPSLQYFTQAGGKLDPELIKKFARYAKDTGRRFYVMYGQTEATARIAYMPCDKLLDYPNCIGIPIPQGEIRLFDKDQEVKSHDTPGEIVYRGPNVMMGYANDRDDLSTPVDTHELRTGDIACKNKDGLYYIVGRTSRFLKLFGQRINLDEVESFLRKQGKSVICGGTDQQLVVLTTNINEANNIKDLIIAFYRLTANIVTVIEADEIPLLPSGKPDYVKLNRMAKEVDVNTIAIETSNKKNIFQTLLSLLYSREGKPKRPVKDCFANVLGLNDIPEDECFLSLSADSLNYVALSIELENTLGYLPDKWESISIRNLQALALSQISSGNDTEESIWNSINYFRAIAILLIVASHCTGTWHTGHFVEKILKCLVEAGTILFIFISGFIFHHSSASNFKYIRLIIGKIKSLVIPYIILSVVLTISKDYIMHPMFPMGHQSVASIYTLKKALLSLLIGSALPPYWYIPCIMLIFLMSPVFIKLVNMQKRYGNILIGVLFMASLFTYRPYSDHTIRASLYFTPVFLLGMISSKYKASVYNGLKNRIPELFLSVIALAFMQVLFYNRTQNVTQTFAFQGIDLQLIQKILMCYLFMMLFHKFENVKSPILNLLASTSFAIYFLHYAVIEVFHYYMHINHLSSWPRSPLTWMLHSVIFTTVSILIALSSKKIFRSWSRYLIGY